MKRYLEYRGEKSQKFWEIVVEKSVVITRWGRIGTKGQSKTNECETLADAKKAALKSIGEKTRILLNVPIVY